MWAMITSLIWRTSTEKKTVSPSRANEAAPVAALGRAGTSLAPARVAPRLSTLTATARLSRLI
jgi:hypothetical protein